MKITLVSPFNPFPVRHVAASAHLGGVERVFAEIARGLARRGHEVTVVCSTQGAAAVAVQDGVTVRRVPRRATVMRTPVADLAAHLPEEADVVQVPATYPFTTPPVLRRAKRMGTPTVLDFHFEPRPGGLMGRLAAGAYRQVGPRAYPLADLVVVRSLAYGRSARSLAAVHQERWRVVPNGIDVARFTPEGQREEGDYLLFVGRLVPYKGLEVLLRALALSPPGLPLVVAGDGPLRPALTAMAQRLGVDARFLGHIPDERLPGLYRGARLTLLPSVNQQEAFGITLLESMACGTPVVASDLPGVAEVARLGGLTAATGDAASFAAAVRQALDGTPLRGPPLSRKIHAGYSWEAVTRGFENVYAEARQAGVNGPAHPRGHPVL